MIQINRTDTIQVTGRRGGSTVLMLTVGGATSIGDVFKKVRGSAPECVGVMSLSLRNKTQGWTQQHNVVFRETPKQEIHHRKGGCDTGMPSLFDGLL